MKLSLESDDGIPCVLMTDAALARLNDTVEYKGMDCEAAPTRAKKTSSGAEAGKVGLNYLDLIDDVVADLRAKLIAAKVAVREEIVTQCARKLLEFVFRGCRMEVAQFAKNGEVPPAKQLETMESTIQY